MVNPNQTLFIIQDVGRCDNNAKIIAVLEEMNQQYITIGNIPFTDIYTNFTEDNVIKIMSYNKFVCFSSIKMLRGFCDVFYSTPVMVNEYHEPLAEEVQEILHAKIGSGYWYSRLGFNQNVYGQDPSYFLNADAEYYLLSELKTGIKFESDKFVKPSSDLKWFTADIMYAGQTINDFLTRQITMSDIHEGSFDTTVMVAGVKDVSKMVEIRTFVINGDVVAGSFYGLNSNRGTEEMFTKAIEWEVCYLQKCNRLPAQSFVLDMCYNLDTEEIRIVEFNCINCSGVYDSDLYELIAGLVWES